MLLAAASLSAVEWLAQPRLPSVSPGLTVYQRQPAAASAGMTLGSTAKPTASAIAMLASSQIGGSFAVRLAVLALSSLTGAARPGTRTTGRILPSSARRTEARLIRGPRPATRGDSPRVYR